MSEISIIVPCYNQAQYLDECLQSVLEQTYHNWECIIVDDGSPDNTEDIAQKWVKKDARFKYLKKENGGVSSARNFGIERANGTWILPLDGDDKIGNQYLELASKSFNTADLIYCDGQFFGSSTKNMDLPEFNPFLILFENQIFCTTFFKKNDWKLIGGFDETMHLGYEDWDFWLSFISLKKDTLQIKKLNYLGFYYRIKNASRNSEAIKVNDFEIRNYIFSKHTELFQNHLQDFLNLLIDNRKLQAQIDHYKNILNSKRYLYINKLFSFFKR